MNLQDLTMLHAKAERLYRLRVFCRRIETESQHALLPAIQVWIDKDPAPLSMSDLSEIEALVLVKVEAAIAALEAELREAGVDPDGDA